MVQLATWMILVVLLGAVTEVRASLALGADEQEITAKYGAPAAAVRPDGMAVYSWQGWTVEIRYLRGKVGVLTFRKDEPLREVDLATLLEQNGTRGAWRELPADGEEPRRWVRADDAKGFWSADQPQTFTLQASTRKASSPPPAIRQGNSAQAAPVPSAAALLPALTLIGIVIVLVRTSKKTSVAQSSAQHVAQHITAGFPPALPKRSLSWEDFECQVGEVYRRQGFTVQISEALGADGGVDIRLRKDDEVVLVQCKSSEKWKVGAPVVREFFGVLVSEGAHRGIVVSKASFSRDAKEFAAGKPLQLIDGTAWSEMVVEAENPDEDLEHLGPWLDEFVAHASWTGAVCPACKSQMRLRSPESGSRFWGCSQFPRCRGKRHARAALLDRSGGMAPAKLAATVVA